MAGLTDVDNPFVKTENACKICGSSEGDMESIFCDADDTKMLNKIYKCTRVEVTPVCGLISPICECCRRRIDAFDENAKPKVVEFVIKNETDQDALDYDPLNLQDPMAPCETETDIFEDVTLKLEIDMNDQSTAKAKSSTQGEKVATKTNRIHKAEIKDNEKENISRVRTPRKATEKVTVEVTSDDPSDSEWEDGNGSADDDDRSDSDRSKDSSDDNKPLKKQKERKRTEKVGKRKVGRPRKPRPEGKDSKTPEECKICGRVVTYMREHMRQHRIDKQHKCPYCDRMFVQGNNLKYHIRKHLGEKPYSCELCDKTFYCAPHLKSHMRVHGPQGLFQCEKCPKTFNQECNLKKHLRVHTGEKPYKCLKCNKAFNSTSNLKNHQRLHSDERAFTCEHCAKSFVDIHHLQRHVRVHTGRRPYICHVCCHAFNCQNGIRDHLKTHIPERLPLKTEAVA
ncbi:zinc finger protein 184-like isoform X2 [Toxorhynchites rutilus septentrionalis]|uniref:zinc finger protein 184-like isoform X2 n=1 Tax=Toxorhynchites rutilus septentrionalis TaxID=329112 RepID=UPI002478C6C3|nr:zinc finger protein 184-like isoform X2 [Toxorhynchites rutilus septentrionalis]